MLRPDTKEVNSHYVVSGAIVNGGVENYLTGCVGGGSDELRGDACFFGRY